MSYWLGVDVGTAFIAAAICRQQPDGRSHLDLVPLSSRSDVLRSVVYVGYDGEVVVGEAAERRAAAEPDRVVREFTRSIRDDVPIVIGDIACSAADLTASVVSWVVDRVAQREGGPAHGITVTVPASWHPGQVSALAGALGAAALPQITLCTGAQAAARNYAMRQRVDTGSTLAVYDLGGGSFDAAVVRKSGPAAYSVVGVPEGIGDVGGAAFDGAVFGYVLGAIPALTDGEPDATARLRRSFALCRRECTEAKEALSVATEVTIPVLFPQVQSQVRLSRAQFEDLIRPQLARTVEALRRTLASAGVAPADLDAVLLVGGSSRMPIVAQLLSAEFGCPVAVDPQPQAALALGAALSGFPAGGAQPADFGVEADGLDVQPVTAGASPPMAGPQAPEPAQPEPAQPEPHQPPWLAAAPMDVESFDAAYRRASARRLAGFAAAGMFALVLAGGAVSAPFIMTAHRGPAAAPAGITAPKAPAVFVAPVLPRRPAPGTAGSQAPGPEIPEPPVTTAAPVPVPSAGSDARGPRSGNSTRADPTTAAPPSKRLTSTTRSKAATASPPDNGVNRPKAPAATTPAPARQVPAWVTQERS